MANTLSEKILALGPSSEVPYRVDNSPVNDKINKISLLGKFEPPTDDGRFDQDSWNLAVEDAKGETDKKKGWETYDGKPVTRAYLKKSAEMIHDKKVRVNKPADPRFGKQHLLNYIRQRGFLKNQNEVAGFMGQMAHESNSLTDAYEGGSIQGQKNKKWKNYTPEKNRWLGNLNYEDAWEYRGRGYVQLTGRKAYTWFQNKLKNSKLFKERSIDIINNPDQAADPDIAALIAETYWTSDYTGKRKDGSSNLQYAGRAGDIKKQMALIQGHGTLDGSGNVREKFKGSYESRKKHTDGFYKEFELEKLRKAQEEHEKLNKEIPIGTPSPIA